VRARSGLWLAFLLPCAPSIPGACVSAPLHTCGSHEKTQFKLSDELSTKCATGGAEEGLDRTRRIDRACEMLNREIEAGVASGLATPSVLFVGATGGLRDAIEHQRVEANALSSFTHALERAFQPSHESVRFSCLSGEQEAIWELEAARTIWGSDAANMFGDKANGETFGLFSGGGQSMQLGMDGLLRSFPFSTWSDAMDEKAGAPAEAWTDVAVWGQWEEALTQQVNEERSQLPNRIGGCFVLTAMNEVAAKAAGFDLKPTRASEAIAHCRAAPLAFRADERAERSRCEACAQFLQERAHYKYNVARVVAMHLSRLAIVLEVLFEEEVRLFAPNVRGSLHCEWALGAFAGEVRSRQLTTGSLAQYALDVGGV